MSWEEHPPELRVCPCGKGHYSVVDRSDDWGRYDSRWSMECLDCRSAYRLHDYQINHKGMIENHYGWVRAPLLKELRSIEEQTRVAERSATTYLVKLCSKEWRDHFSQKNKKAIWSELTQEGKHYPALGTFYNHVRHFGVEKYLEHYLNYSHVDIVTRVLSVNDSKLRDVTNTVKNLENRVDKRNRSIRTHVFR